MRKDVILSFLMFIAFVSNAQNLLRGPQKIVIDAKRNLLLVSNFDSGDLVQIDSVGNQSLFVTGADFVDGLEIVGDTIYGIGSNRVIHAYNLETKELVWNLTIPGNPSKYLSSITSDSAGHLFISCPQSNEIYKLRISDQAYWAFASNNGLNKPNGILLEKEKNRIVVIDDSPSPSLIHAISLTDSTVSTLATTQFSSPDGITRDKYGNHYVGGYYLPGMYVFDPDFSKAPVLFFTGSHIVYPTYDPSDHSLLVTYYESNSWGRVPLSTKGTSSQNLSGDPILYPAYLNPGNSLRTQVQFE